MAHPPPNRWKGALLGAVAGLAGTWAMGYYWQAVTAVAGKDPRQEEKADKTPQPLDNISLVGQQHRKGESSTAAVGRFLYTRLTGKPPARKETRDLLSNLVHYGFGLVTGAIYGVGRAGAGVPDVRGGLAHGLGVWALGDELALPLLGLSEGPSAYPSTMHAYGAGAHAVYGLTVAATEQILDRLL